MLHITFGLYDFTVYLRRKGPCELPAQHRRHRRYSSRNPLKAWRAMRAVRKQFPKSSYYMVMERRV